ncbi:response regulator [Chlorogloeopsis sp. ULAP01]|uniref:hybrid sensor histidine kinase/response regulator n=1 Tax=Chlorogloeopsis sp. ULAP01 TaxID=3056483 RepID=UPI0025AA61BD|nr:response regulator [Chlorogloeopsis sp. ULAP01]MDM9380836.1 response regulator [Chlorogloeopsis sp. ULAP01]
MSFEPKVNVLLVDDHPENLLALEAILDSLGQNLVRATSGAEALRHLLNQDFAVILLDVQMPDMDGFETATLIRQRERSRHTPIIFVTAFNTSDNMVYKGYSLGAVDYLFKPIEPEILKSKVAAFIDLFQKTAEVKRQALQLAAMNAELRKREEMFRSLSACSPVGIFLADKLGKCTYVNPCYQAIFGLTNQDNLDEAWTQRIHLQDKKQIVADWYTATREGREYKGEFRILTPEKNERWVYLSSSPMLSEEGNVIGFVGTVEDSTDRKKAEEEHIKLIREQAARQEAETANRLKDEFLATLSHELRTPLTSILGWARLLRQRKLDEKAIARAIETIERNATLQAQLIEDILDVSRIMRGKLNLNICPVNLETIISTVTNGAYLEAEAKNIQLKYFIESSQTEGETQQQGKIEEENNSSASPSSLFPPSSLIVSGDSNRLQQVVWNLLNNAIKFTPSGGKIEVRLSRASDWGLDTKDRKTANPQSPIPNYAQITVKDTGIGISPDFLPHVFDRFRQADGSITRNHGGLGLGLAIVRYLVEMHGGSVHADSAGVGQGATFTVTLPLLETEQQQTGEDTEEGEWGDRLKKSNLSAHQLTSLSSPESPLCGLQILLVDDTETQEQISSLLQESGAKVTAVASVNLALSAIDKSQPDILIADICLLKEDDYTLLQKLRNLQPQKHGKIPAIALFTDSKPQEDSKTSQESAFQIYISKPVEPINLISSVAKLVQSNCIV